MVKCQESNKNTLSKNSTIVINKDEQVICVHNDLKTTEKNNADKSENKGKNIEPTLAGNGNYSENYSGVANQGRDKRKRMPKTRVNSL